MIQWVKYEMRYRGEDESCRPGKCVDLESDVRYMSPPENSVHIKSESKSDGRNRKGSRRKPKQGIMQGEILLTL